MRLINVDTLKLETFVDDKIPPYAVLSHTWGDVSDEVSYQDIEAGAVHKPGNGGAEKVRGCCALARGDGLGHVWIDTCCIDKTNSVELGEAINSMFRWYKSAACCYAYLADVPAGDDCRSPESKFFASRWFRRGWTLQELLAPEEVRFYNQEWASIGTKGDMSHEIEIITDIPGAFLLGWRDFRNASVAQRMSWAAKRSTTRREDIAYCLLGVFDVMMPMIYGEGDGALIRLQQEIMRKTGDQSILAWGLEVSNSGLLRSSSASVTSAGILANTPLDFAHCRNIVSRGQHSTAASTFEISGGFLRIELPIHTSSEGDTYGLLNCGPGNAPEQTVGIPLVSAPGVRLNEHIRPQGRSPIVISKMETNAAIKTIHIQVERQAKGRESSSRQYWLHLAGYQKSGLELRETYPPLQWEQQRALIANSHEADAPNMSQYLARFRTQDDNPQNAVLVLNFEVQSLQLQARCHVMTLSRDLSLQDLSQNLAYMRPEAFGTLGACLGSSNLKVTVQEESVDEEPLFVVRLARTVDPPKTTVDADKELEHVALKLDTLRGLLEEDEESEGPNMSAKLAESSKPSLDEVKKRLGEMEKKLLKLNKHERFNGPGNWLETIIQIQLDTGKLRKESEDGANSESLTQTSSKALPPGDATPLQTPLAWAMSSGHEALVKILLEKAGNLETRDQNGDTLLTSAAGSGHAATVRLLLSQGVQVEARDKDGQTALLCAARNGHKDVAEMLLAQGGAALETTDGNGDTPLICAARRGDEALAELLLKHGADPEARDGSGRTPLLCAAESGHDAIVGTLLDRGMDVEMRDRDGSTPLIWAAYNGYETVVARLLGKGAEIEAKNKYGNTPLLQAACKGHAGVTGLLLKSGADVKARNRSGNTPLLLAAGNGHEAVIRLLLEKRASVNVRNKYGDTPLVLAANGHHEVVKLLRDNGAKKGLLSRVLR